MNKEQEAQLKETIYQGLGEASTAWDKDGVFQSEKCERIGREILKEVKALLKSNKQELEKEIDKLITIHIQLSEEIVGNNNYHIGAIKVLENLKIDLK